MTVDQATIALIGTAGGILMAAFGLIMQFTNKSRALRSQEGIATLQGLREDVRLLEGRLTRESEARQEDRRNAERVERELRGALDACRADHINDELEINRLNDQLRWAKTDLETLRRQLNTPPPGMP